MKTRYRNWTEYYEHEFRFATVEHLENIRQQIRAKALMLQMLNGGHYLKTRLKALDAFIDKRKEANEKATTTIQAPVNQ